MVGVGVVGGNHLFQNLFSTGKKDIFFDFGKVRNQVYINSHKNIKLKSNGFFGGR